MFQPSPTKTIQSSKEPANEMPTLSETITTLNKEVAPACVIISFSNYNKICKLGVPM